MVVPCTIMVISVYVLQKESLLSYKQKKQQQQKNLDSVWSETFYP